jgi:DNA repair protein RadA/Sms
VACTISLEGRRPLVSELQALVVPTTLAMPRRTAQGLDASRLVILVAVLERRAGVGLSGRDVFAQTAGGMRVTEPAADLAICLALASAAKDRTVPADMIALGEIGLGGEIRPVPQPSRRLAEAVRLGFRRALVPPGTKVPDGITAIETASVAEAIRAIEPHGGSTSGRPRRAGSSSGATAPGVTPSVEAGGPR